MGMEARLMLGPRDGEVLQVVEATEYIAVMAEPTRRHANGQDAVEYTEYIYQRADEPIREGVWYYNYQGEAPQESETT